VPCRKYAYVFRNNEKDRGKGRGGNQKYTQCVTHTTPAYMKWAISQITTWVPQGPCPNLYHIHGTKDQTFPYRRIKNAVLIEDGDHLMVMKKPEAVNKALNDMLLSANQ
jgi:hypothetical protein